MLCDTTARVWTSFYNITSDTTLVILIVVAGAARILWCLWKARCRHRHNVSGIIPIQRSDLGCCDAPGGGMSEVITKAMTTVANGSKSETVVPPTLSTFF